MLYFSKWKIAAILIVCFLAILFSAPNFIPANKKDSFPFKFLPNNKVSLGLDLQGGSYLLLQIDFDFYLKEQLSNFQQELKKEFTEEDIRALPENRGSKIVFSLTDEEMIRKAKKLVRKVSKDFSI